MDRCGDLWNQRTRTKSIAEMAICNLYRSPFEHHVVTILVIISIITTLLPAHSETIKTQSTATMSIHDRSLVQSEDHEKWTDRSRYLFPVWSQQIWITAIFTMHNKHKHTCISGSNVRGWQPADDEGFVLENTYGMNCNTIFKLNYPSSFSWRGRTDPGFISWIVNAHEFYKLINDSRSAAVTRFCSRVGTNSGLFFS